METLGYHIMSFVLHTQITTWTSVRNRIRIFVVNNMLKTLHAHTWQLSQIDSYV